MFLKNITLASKFLIYYNGKPIEEFFDFVSAGIFLYFVAADGLKYKLGNRNVNHLRELKVVYWDTKELELFTVDEFKRTEYFKKNNRNSMIILGENEDNKNLVLANIQEIRQLIEKISLKFIKKDIKTHEELNTQLEDILQYWLYDDKSFSDMSEHYSNMLFWISIKKKDTTKISVGDKILELHIDEADSIPDELIEYAETKLWFDWKFCAKLRKIIGYEPWDRQRYALVTQKRFTYVVCSRKYGKSFRMAYLAIRQLFLPNQDIVYVVPDFTMADQVYFYLERFIRDTGDSALRFDKARRQVSYTTTRSNIIFVSWESKYVGRSRKANLLLYDEASFLLDIVENTLRPLISNTMGFQVAVSTPSPTTPINWFYYGFKKGELGTREDHLSIRRDIYHNKWIPDVEKQNLIDHYKNDPVMSQSELLAMFPINAGAFNLVDFFLHYTDHKEFVINGIKIRIKNDVEELKKEYSGFVIGYDPALLKDKWWFSLFGIKRDKVIDNGIMFEKNTFEIISSAYINFLDYTHQINFLVTMQETLMDVRHEVYVGMDYTGAGMWVYELMQSKGIKNITRIMWTAQNKRWQPFFDNGFRRVSKVDLESFFRTNMGTMVFGYNFLEELRWEIEMYGTAIRSNGDSHFDQLSAAFVGFFVCKRYIGEFSDNYTGNKTQEQIMAHMHESLKQAGIEPQGELFLGGKRGSGNRLERFRRFIY